MPEKEMQETRDGESCACGGEKKCVCKKVLSLKGLSIIYKVFAALLLVYLLYILIMIWYIVFKDGASKWEAVLGSIQFIITYGFYALIMYTIAKVLHVLKKIKKAVAPCK